MHYRLMTLLAWSHHTKEKIKPKRSKDVKDNFGVTRDREAYLLTTLDSITQQSNQKNAT